ncbi:hypothetical protein [Vibrio phage BUCT006]|nr:hypothetical protein [Vibrio phage BUCT006]
MTAHKHAEMIKAKAYNMDLVVFEKSKLSGWIELARYCFPDDDGIDYFLCLPQHKEACLHWLNGGEIEYDNVKNWIAYDLTIDSPKYPLQDFTGLEFNFRIKPRKEKRWICINDDLEIEDGTLYESYADAEENSPCYKQVVEIEVEI